MGGGEVSSRKIRLCQEVVGERERLVDQRKGWQ